MNDRPVVLFLCIHNSGRSLAARVLLNHYAEGRIDVRGTMQEITAVVESWVREHPEQWLWLHRRWR